MLNDLVTAGIQVGPFDKVTIAAQAILLDNEKIKKYVNGNVSRGEILALPRGFSGNRIFVSLLPPQSEGQLGTCADFVTPLVLSIAWEQPAEELQPGEPSIYSLIAEILKTMTASNNAFLQHSVTGGERLVRGIRSFRQLGQPQFADQPSSVLIVSSFVFEYDQKVNLQANSVIG